MSLWLNIFCLSVAYWIRFKISSWHSRPSYSWLAFDILYFLLNTDSMLFIGLFPYTSSQLCSYLPLWFAHVLLSVWNVFFLFFSFSEVQLDQLFWNFLAGWLAGSFISFSFSFLLSTFSVLGSVSDLNLNHLNHLFFSKFLYPLDPIKTYYWKYGIYFLWENFVIS